MENLNQDEREFEDNDVETDDLNSQDGEETTEEPMTLSEWNEKTGKNFKSWDDVAKSQKQIDKDFAQGKVKKEQPAQVNDFDDITEMFMVQNPVAEVVKDDLKTIADAKYNGSIIKAWKGEGWLRDKATALENSKKEEEISKSKISAPASFKGSNKSFENVTLEDLKKMSSSDKVKYTKYMASKETKF